MKKPYYISAMEAHIRGWESGHFEKTGAGRRIKRYCNAYQGQKCFIIGNGPSLRTDDLERIRRSGIPSFAMNRIFNLFPETKWRPTYYVCEDILILRGIEDRISAMDAAKFIPVNLKWYEDVNIKDAIYFWLDYNSEMKETFGLSTDAAHSVRCRGTVTSTCIQLAIYMGFSEIYLLGIDHNYSKSINEEGKVVEDPSVKDYFADDYDSDIKDQVVHDMRAPTQAFASVEQLSRKLNTFRVYNATRGGRLEIFERVDFDEVVPL